MTASPPSDPFDPTQPSGPDHRAGVLPPDAPWRDELHNEVHARPSARIRLPALVVFVAVLNEGVSREQELEHLRRLPGQAGLQMNDMRTNFLRLRFDQHTLKWERHTEFTRYSIVQALPAHAFWGAVNPELASQAVVGSDWLREIPGQTVAAIHLGMLEGDMASPELVAKAQAWLGEGSIVGSRMGNTTEGVPHSCVLTHFRLGPDGFERMLVVAPPGTSDTRSGRISQRLLELETYRLMALRGLPVSKALSPTLAQAEAQLASITAQMENKAASEQDLLDQLISLAARVERATAENTYRFGATRAYDALVTQRITELREKPIPGTQTIGEFMQRRLSPAMATVAATGQRLTSLSERVSRASDLLRTRVDIATETHNRIFRNSQCLYIIKEYGSIKKHSGHQVGRHLIKMAMHNTTPVFINIAGENKHISLINTLRIINEPDRYFLSHPYLIDILFKHGKCSVNISRVDQFKKNIGRIYIFTNIHIHF